MEVNGAGAHPLFAWLKQHTPGDQTGFAAGEDIRWNFEKVRGFVGRWGKGCGESCPEKAAVAWDERSAEGWAHA